jgi:RimJ/RimL family protein N-acetyltransferase
MKSFIHPRIALWWTDVILSLDLGAPLDLPAQQHENVTMETVAPDEPLSRLAGLPDHRRKRVLEARRRRGDTCVIARLGTRIVGFAWLARGPWVLRDAGLKFGLDRQTEAIVYDFFTAVEYRGRGIMQQMIRRLAEVAKAQGRERLYARAERGNLSSIAAMERVRFIQVASIKTLRLFVFAALHSVDVPDGNDAFYKHARRHLRRTRPGLLRWRYRSRRGPRVHVCTNAGG